MKKKKKKNLDTEPGWPLPIEHGAGRCAGRAGRRRGAGMARKAQRAGRGSRLGRWAARRAVGVRAPEGARARADVQAAARAARRWQAHGWASGRAAGRTVRAGHGRQAARARSLCAQAGPAGLGWGFVHPTWFSAWFF